LLTVAGELERAPAAREPDAVAAGDELDGEQDGDDLEDVRGAAGGQR